MERTSSQPTSLFPLTCRKRISINSFPRSHINSGTAKLILLPVSNLFAPRLISTETVDTILWHYGYLANRQHQRLKSAGRGGGCRKRSSTRRQYARQFLISTPILEGHSFPDHTKVQTGAGLSLSGFTSEPTPGAAAGCADRSVAITNQCDFKR